MATSFGAIAFTKEVKALQEKAGSRTGYARMEKTSYQDGLTDNEAAFISQRDSFYMASMGENNFPYIQHRGGPAGFLKVLDAKRIGFLDFTGNRQYVSVGNIVTHPNVSLIMVDYPARARLKILARAEVVEIKDNPELYAQLQLDPAGYRFRPERMMLFHIEAYDWNCPQHITPRYTVEEIEAAFGSQQDHLQKLQAEIISLKEQLRISKVNREQ